MKQSLTYSAPAKVILSGEHAVVYGKPALITAIDKRLQFSLWESKKNTTDRVISYVSEIVRKYLRKKNTHFTQKHFDFKIASTIPRRQGLGSSAALSVAAVAAFLEFYTEQKFDSETINNISYTVEKYFHTNPSGADNTASCFGGLVYFRREFEFLKTISLLNLKIPSKIEDRLYLINTGKPKEKTKEMIDHVGKIYNSDSKMTEKIICDIEKVTKRMVMALIKEDPAFFKQAIYDNQLLLKKLDIVSETTQKLLGDLKNYGVGKVTGAGGIKTGSGYLLFYAEKPEALKQYLKNNAIFFIKFNQSNLGFNKE